MPVARNAEPMLTRGNWRKSAGMNQIRYLFAKEAVSESAVKVLQYQLISPKPQIPNADPTRIDTTNDWLNASSACGCSFRPAAWEITAVVPTPSIWVNARTIII